MSIQPHHHRRGFTLTEVLISIGLALLIIYGVNVVFKATADTIGTGQSVSEANRGLRGIDTNLASDFNPQVDSVGVEVPGTGIISIASATVTNPQRQPAIAIRNQVINAFASKLDYDLDFDKNVITYDPTQDGPPEPAIPTTLGPRTHRIDTLSFFTSGKTGPVGTELGSFRRQTGQIMNGRESLTTELGKPAEAAWVWYGHGNLPDNPDSTVLLPTNYRQPGQGTKNAFAADWVLARKAVLILKRDTIGVLTPPDGYVFDAKGYPMYFYRATNAADLSPVGYNSVAAYSGNGAHVNDTLAAGDGMYIQSGLYDIAALTDGVGDAIALTGLYQKFATNVAMLWVQLVEDGAGNAYRFNVNPFVTPPMISQPGQLSASAKTALSSAIIAPGCTQFIVEFAGDFDTTNGVDVRSEDPDGAGPLAPIQSIQWYGLLRDADGNGSLDVVPLTGSPAGTKAFERTSAAGVYNCVWGPTNFDDVKQRPSLIRITVTLVDGNNRLQDGITREFIYRVR